MSVAIIFYLLFIVGIFIFAILPAVDKGSLGNAIVMGALFGFFTYATYDLTNLATLTRWPLSVTLADLVHGQKKGRTDERQITWSERGNLQGAQFYAVAGRVYELAKKAGLGHEIPTEWFLQDIRN